MGDLLARTRNPQRRAELQAELACPSMPDELGYLWRIYRRLSARRGAGFGANPISYVDIEAFCRLSGTRLAPWELEVIESLDNLFRSKP